MSRSKRLAAPDTTSSALADTLATSSPAGAVEILALPNEHAVSAGGLGGAAPAGRFELSLDRDPAALGRAFLVYDLSGLSSVADPIRRINGSPALGGFRPLPAADGGIQVEEIPPAALHGGSNTIEFLPTSKDDVVGYKVAHVRLVFVPQPSGSSGPDLVIAHPLHGECSGGAAYVRGFVSPAANASGRAQVLIDGRPARELPADDGSFALVVDPPGRESSTFSFEVIARYPDGTSVSRPVTVDGCEGDDASTMATLASAAHAKGKLVEDQGAPFGAVVTPWAPKTLSFGGATIEIPAGAVDKTVRVTIRPLPASQLATMNEGMKNVTPRAGGYAFGPHGLTFKTPVNIKLPVDDALLPTGKGHDDVRAFYYDEQDRRWKSVNRFSPDHGKTRASHTTKLATGDVVSRTTHFTDFVNATLAVPEHPTAESFNENMMKDMKLGDPAAGLTLIEPPSANSFGSANLSYPIEVPPGRNGIQPELSIRYNSDNTQNGWLGVGWDLTLPSIEVDTRFGAPAYDTTNETESYLFDGEALAPTAKLDGPDPRSTDPKTFFRRVEGKFDRIVRSGSSPSTYTWVVTDQRGTRFTFGSSANSKLEAYPGATPGIFRWYLDSVVDTFGNEMDVTYAHDSGNNGEPFTQTYPQSIAYTSSKPNNFAAAYSVFFDLEPRCDLDANGKTTSNRCDQSVTGRPGFQVKTNFRLHDIRVLQGVPPGASHLIRQYNLAYLDGDFHKSLLSTIEQVGKSGGSLGTHKFHYKLLEPDPGTGVGTDVFNLFDEATPWGHGVHRTDGGLTHSEDQTKGGSVGGGIGLGPFSATASGGGFGGDETPHIAFLDQNGDGLPDQLDDGAQASFNFLTSRASPPKGDFFSTFPIPPNAGSPPPFLMPNFIERGLGHTDRSGWTVQGTVSLGGFLGGSIGYSHTSTDDDHIVSDINGDGFPDLVQVGDDDIIKVALNDQHRGYQSLAPFGAGSGGEINRDDLTPSHRDRDDKVAVDARAVDPLIRWVAPFGVVGTVALSAPIRKLKAGGIDGVTAEIWTQNGASGFPTLLWHRTIGPADVTTCFPVQGCDPQTNCGVAPAGVSDACGVSGALTVPVAPGTRIYTKLDSGKDSRHDDVSWDPKITYTASDPSQQPLREPYGPLVYQFSQGDDHRLSGGDARWTASADGSVDVTGAIANKFETLDDVTAHLILTDVNQVKKEVAVSSPIPHGATGLQPVSFTGIQVKKNESLTLQVDSDTRLDSTRTASIVDDPDNFIITPLDPERALVDATVSYRTFVRFDPKTGALTAPAVVTCDPNPSLGCHIVGDPLPNNPIPFDVINQKIEPFYPFIQYLAHPPTAGSFRNGTVSIGGLIDNTSSFFPILAVAEGVNHRLFKQVVPAATSFFVPPGTTGTTTDEVVFTIYTVNDPLALIGAASWSATLDGGSVQTNLRQPDSDFGVDGAGNPKDVMTGGYHSFFYGDWLGDVPFELAPTFMTAAAVFNQPPGSVSTFMFVAPLEEGLDAIPPLPPRPAQVTQNPPAWVGRGAGEYIAAAEQKPARLKGFGTSGHGLSAVDGLRESTTTNVDTSLSVAVINAGVNKGQTNSEIDFLDMNGDRFPDSVYMDGVRFNTGTQLLGKVGPGPASAAHFDFTGLGDMRRVEHGTGRLGAKFSEDSQDINETDTAGSPSKTISTGFEFGIDYGLSSTEIDVVDINGDGLPDHLRRQRGDDDAQIVVELNLGHSFSKPIVWATDKWQLGPPGGGVAQKILNFLSSDTMSTATLRLQDTIGDNIGLGADGNVVGGGGGRNVTQTRTFIDLVDVNGDGMPDQVFRNPGGDLRVKLNLGDRFATEQSWGIQAHWPVDIEDTDIQADIGKAIGGATGADHDPDALAFTRGSSLSGSISVKVCVVLCVTGSGFYSQGSSSSQMGFEDIDGDGKPDHVLKLDDNNQVYVKRNHVDQSNLLIGVDRPLTGDHTDPSKSTIALNYTRDGNRVSSPSLGAPNNPDMPNNQWVLTETDVNDGQGNKYSTTMVYGNGIYNRDERENQGYSAVTTTRPDGSTIEERFVNGAQDPAVSGIAQGATKGADAFYTRGRLYERIERDGPPPVGEPAGTSTPGRIFARTTTKWQLAITPPTDGSQFPQDNTDTTFLYEGTTTDVNAAPKSTHQTRAYDGFGNVTAFADFGEEGTSGDDVTYNVTYSPPAANYVIRPSRVTAVAASTTLRQRDATYGAHGELSTLTLTLSGGIDPTTGQPYLGAHNPFWQFFYDAFGNVKTVIDPDVHETDYLYDDVAQTYRKQITDHDFGYVSTSVPNLSFGTVDTTTDINGQSEHFDYDEFGRLIQVFSPRDIGSTIPTISINYSVPGIAVSNGSPAYAVTKHKDEQHLAPLPADTIDTAVFIDGLKRVLQTKKDLEKDPGTGITSVGFATSGLVRFDTRGRVSEQSQPNFFTTGDIATFVTEQQRNPTVFTYDILSRVKTVTTPDNGVTTTAYAFGSPTGDPTLRHTKTVTDPNGKFRVFYQSVRDEILAVQEQNTINGQAKTLTTRYAYDPLSELLTVTDTKNNVTTATYDTLGQMVSLKNPDTGQVNYRFDLAGNLAAKETPNLHAAAQLIKRIYDHDRLIQIDYPTSADVFFTYGAVGAPDNQAGRISAIDDESGHQEFSYGSMGELVKEARRLRSVRNEKIGDDRNCDAQNCDQDGHPLNQFEHDCSPPPTYVTQFKRDSFDRLLELTYPDGEVMSYAYDKGGSLNTVTSVTPVPDTTQRRLRHAVPTLTTYVNHIGYDEFGQRANIYLGNGVTTSYTYDPLMRRLTDVGTNRPDKDIHGNPIVVPLQRLHYTYDLVGNVLTFDNNLAVPHDENRTGPTNFTFQYDDLYQLTSATARYQPEPSTVQTHTLGLGYDEIGNITHKDQVDVEQEFNISHTQSDTSYAWDYAYAATGPHQASKITWRDPQPAPIASTFRGARRDYTYDADGNDTKFSFFERNESHSEATRILTWNEEDRLRTAAQDGIHIEDTAQNYLYDSDGTRTQRRIGSGSCPDETKYANQYFVVQNDDVSSKHIYAGDTRVATAIVNEEVLECEHPSPLFYFHTDHLQSTEYLTDRDAKVAEHNEYFAFGETWIDERQDLDNDGRQDYLFTGKELDPGTNLYYFGARYYDPQVSRWESADPVLGMYVKSYRSGGALVPRNLALYTHAYNNPLVFLDPTGTRVPIHQSPVDSFMHEAQEWYYKTAAKDWTKGNYASAVAEATAGALIQAGPTVIGTLLPVAGVTTGPVPPGETLPVTPAAPEVVPVTEPGPVATPPPVAEGAPPTPAAAPAAEAPAATPATGPAAPVSEPPAIGPKPGAKFTPEQQGLAEMAKHDKQTGGITEGDMDAYKQLNTEAGPKGFTAPGAVRGPEVHPPRSPKSTPGPGARPHGHVGPVHHIPIKTRPK